MPQIFPMNWFLITMTLLMLILMINSHIFFFKPFKKIFILNKLNNLNKSNKIFKW